MAENSPASLETRPRRTISRRRLLGAGVGTAAVVTLGDFTFNRDFREKVEVVITTTWYNDLFHPILLIPWVREDDRNHTRLNLIGSHRDGVTTRLTLRAYEAGGSPVAEWPGIDLPSTGFLNIELGSLTGGKPLDGPFKVFYETSAPLQEYLLRVTVDYYDDQNISSVHANPSYKATSGAHELFHQLTARLDGHPTFLNTNQFLARVVLDKDRETYLAIQNCREGNSGAVAHPSLDLFNEQGEALHREIDIPPDGSTFLSVRDLFPTAEAHLAGRPGGLRISDRLSFLWSNAFLYDRRSGSLNVDHLHWT